MKIIKKHITYLLMGCLLGSKVLFASTHVEARLRRHFHHAAQIIQDQDQELAQMQSLLEQLQQQHERDIAELRARIAELEDPNATLQQERARIAELEEENATLRQDLQAPKEITITGQELAQLAKEMGVNPVVADNLKACCTKPTILKNN